jgi:CRISPR-associated endonuclease Csn1
LEAQCVKIEANDRAYTTTIARDIQKRQILGLDLGTNSIGWAIVEEVVGVGGVGVEVNDRSRTTQNYTKILDGGVRIFKGSVRNAETKMTSECATRRNFRQARRQRTRRTRRKLRVALSLQNAGLLPNIIILKNEKEIQVRESEKSRHEQFNLLDAKIRKDWLEKIDPKNASTLDQLPYFLRAKALDEPLTPYELGRALYHLHQHRGYNSNAKTENETEKDVGVVNTGITSLEKEIENSSSRTLGEYFSKLNPHETRIRSRWTSRKMHIDEYNYIMDAQTQYHPNILTPEFREKLFKDIFFQRPLRSQRKLIGNCTLEPSSKRSPKASLEFQEFRLLQKINDLKIINPNFEIEELTQTQREIILKLSEEKENLTFKFLRSKLNLGKGYSFNLEKNTPDSEIKGNVTSARLYKIFGERWNTFTQEEKDQIIEDVRCIRSRDSLKKRGINAWNLDEDTAANFSKVMLEADYAQFSKKAIKKLLPLMRQGMSYMAAEIEIYGEKNNNNNIACNLLPTLFSKDSPINTNNRGVLRVLSETRKIVNGIISKYGKPDLIRIETMRDLKLSAKKRVQITIKNNSRKKEREIAIEHIKSACGIMHPSNNLIEKYLLAKECRWICPYTGLSISMSNLFGSSPMFDVEHIIPYSRCLDNSFLNKTLCLHEENRNVKINNTPYEAYNSNPEKWNMIISNVKKFTSDSYVKNEKLKRFMVKNINEYTETFLNRQKTETSYITTVIFDYLSVLYGGCVDKNGVVRLEKTNGRITDQLRKSWHIHNILAKLEEANNCSCKTRDDHRHHMIDAIVIALTDKNTINELKKANDRPPDDAGKINTIYGTPPWDEFQKDVIDIVNRTTVSHRTGTRIRGALHADTYYSKPRNDPNYKDGKNYSHIRKNLSSLTEKNIKDIVDPAIRKVVKEKLVVLGKPPKIAFKDAKNHPIWYTKDGVEIRIHRVRIKKKNTTIEIGNSNHKRYLENEKNHHLEIFECLDGNRRGKWGSKIVNQLEAARRNLKNIPIIQKNHDLSIEDANNINKKYRYTKSKFVMSISTGDILELDNEVENQAGLGKKEKLEVNARPKKRELYLVRGIYKDKKLETMIIISFSKLNDSRKDKDIKNSKDWFRVSSIDKFQSFNPQKAWWS